jgi:hypothetical protein
VYDGKADAQTENRPQPRSLPASLLLWKKERELQIERETLQSLHHHLLLLLLPFPAFCYVVRCHGVFAVNDYTFSQRSQLFVGGGGAETRTAMKD